TPNAMPASARSNGTFSSSSAHNTFCTLMELARPQTLSIVTSPAPFALPPYKLGFSHKSRAQPKDPSVSQDQPAAARTVKPQLDWAAPRGSRQDEEGAGHATWLSRLPQHQPSVRHAPKRKSLRG